MVLEQKIQPPKDRNLHEQKAQSCWSDLEGKANNKLRNRHQPRHRPSIRRQYQPQTKHNRSQTKQPHFMDQTNQKHERLLQICREDVGWSLRC